MRHARLQRDAYESIDKAWNGRTVTLTRIAALTRQLEADRKTIAAFQKEYELGQRSLIDLLNAQNEYFNAAVSLTSARSVAVFADYQLLAAMGTLIEYLKAPPDVDAAPVDLLSFGLPAYTVPTLRMNLPQTGSEPVRVPVPAASATTGARPVSALASVEPRSGDGFQDCWPSKTTVASSKVSRASEWMAQQKGGSSTEPKVIYGDLPAEANSYAAATKPHWLLSAFPVTQK